MNRAKTSLMEAYLIPVWEKVSHQRHLAAIRNGLTVMIPMTIIGGISCILAVPPVPSTITEPSNFFYFFLLVWKNWAAAHVSVLSLPYYLTIGIISIYVAAGIACQLARSYHMDIINNVLSTLLVFLCVSNIVDFDTGSLAIERLGANYMFGAMVIALLVVEINHFFIKRNIIINLPDSIPPNITAPFNMLIPLTFNVVVFIFINSFCTNLTGDSLTGLIFSIFQPLMKVTGSLPSVLLINFIITTFWFFGIHGPNMVGVVTIPVTTAALAANMEAYATGTQMQYIFAGNVNSVFGNWITYHAILLVIFTVCKSSRLKSIAKLAIIPSIFNINEPCIFGVPTVLNLYTYIPILICNILNFSTYYLLASAEILGKFYMSLPFTVPGPIAASLAAMDIKNGILWVALLGVNYMITLPFIKIYDNKMIAVERDSQRDETIYCNSDLI